MGERRQHHVAEATQWLGQGGVVIALLVGRADAARAGGERGVDGHGQDRRPAPPERTQREAEGLGRPQASPPDQRSGRLMLAGCAAGACGK